MEVTLSGREIAVSPVQPEKACPEIAVTVDGSVTSVKRQQSKKAPSPMPVTRSPDGEVAGMTTFLSLQLPIPDTTQLPSPLEENESPRLATGSPAVVHADSQKQSVQSKAIIPIPIDLFIFE